MARAQLRKRPRADDDSQDRRLNKKIKSTGELHHRNFPPEFWDGLSKVPLTRRALRELDRRNLAQTAPGPAASVYTTDRARFARHGGPDLRHLRGCPEPKGVDRTMASSRSASSRQTKSTKATDVSSTTKPSSAYDDAFEQHMINNNIYPPFYDFPDDRPTPKPDNLNEHRQRLTTSRASLSPSHFTESKFEDFQRKNKTSSEGTLMRNVIPIIAGGSDFPNEGNLPFTKIKSITGGATVKAVPDFFDGARPGNIDETVRDDLSQMIIPTKHAGVPVAPNFFLEAKAPTGGSDVALRQALHNGAIGARAMHALQNYGDDSEEPSFDGNAYSYSSTYQAGTGTLQLYTHHVTAPTARGGRPEYHMTQVGGYMMTHSRERFVEGASAFRNARDLAKEYRDRFIQTANTRARQPMTLPEAEITVAEAQQYEESTCDEFVDCEDHVRPYAEDEEPSQDSTSAGAEPAISFATSVTSSFSAQSQTSLKRNRASHSPPSNPTHKEHGSAKAWTRQGASRRAAGSSTRASTSTGSAAPQPSSTGGYWDRSDDH